jgi:ABC-2 type transport system permease protein
MGRIIGPSASQGVPGVPRFVTVDLPIFTSLLIAASALMSLVAIIAIYREGGILKRLRATPLRPQTILTAHVLAKLSFTILTLAAMILAGRRVYPFGAAVPLMNFTLALVLSTVSILSLGFLIASVVPTARFAQPVGSLVVYPMLALSGLFFPVASLPFVWQVIARALPFSHAVALMRGMWAGESWLAYSGDLAALALFFVICTAVATRVFRWE